MGDAQLPELTRQVKTVKARFVKIEASIQAVVDKGPDADIHHEDVLVVETAELRLQQATERAKEITDEIVRLQIAAEQVDQVSPAKEAYDDLLEAGCAITAQINLLRLRFPAAVRDAQRRQGRPSLSKRTQTQPPLLQTS